MQNTRYSGLQRILWDSNVAPEPSTYSGRGATISDLDSKKLEAVYQGIKKGYGHRASAEFVRMVGDVEVLSATDFLISLYNLERNGWTWDAALLSKNKGIDIDNDAGAFATLLGTKFPSDRDDTERIRRGFLLTRQAESTAQEYKLPEDAFFYLDSIAWQMARFDETYVRAEIRKAAQLASEKKQPLKFLKQVDAAMNRALRIPLGDGESLVDRVIASY